MASNSNADIQYSPSQWSNKSQGTQRCEEHIECIENYSHIVKQTIPCEINVAYGPGHREYIDIYGIDLPEDSPIIIHFHGGYWQEPTIKHNNNSFIAKNLHFNKVKSFFVGYQLCPEVTLAQLIQNVERALKMCFNHINTLKTRGIHLSGHSAGAQIVAMLFKSFIPSLPDKEQSLFKSAFLITGLYDLVPLLETSYNDVLNLDKESALSASPLYQNLSAKNCEFIIIVAEYDSPKFIEQGEKMYNRIVSLGYRSKFLFMEGVDHFDVIEDLYKSDNELTKVIVKYCTKNELTS